MQTRSIEEFMSLMCQLETFAQEAEDINRNWWADNPPDQGHVPEFRRPDWDIPLAIKLAEKYFLSTNGEYRRFLESQIDLALEPGPNDAHIGATRW